MRLSFVPFELLSWNFSWVQVTGQAEQEVCL